MSSKILRKYGLVLFLLSFIYINVNVNNLNETSQSPTSKSLQQIIEKKQTTEQCSCTLEQKTKSSFKTNYLARYPFLLDCKTDYNKLDPRNITNVQDPDYNYMQPADKATFKQRITRAILVYFPIAKIDYFEIELRWLYRSWIHMQTYESTKWRTDLIVFVDTTLTTHFSNASFFMHQMQCSLSNKRTSAEQKPMCTLIHYRSVLDRNDSFINDQDPRLADPDFFEYLSTKIDIFNLARNESGHFLSYLKANLATYHYLDSILMAFEGYDYFKSAGFDHLIRSDMDVFVTPALATWLPRYCSDFVVGGGGYSSTFNRKRLFRIARHMGFNYGFRDNLGSTWISTPQQFRIVSYLTLLGMAYLAAEEFTEPERKELIGTINWPDWHYGVLLLYGQNIALNHMIGSNQTNVVSMPFYIDYPSGNNRSVFEMLHIHVYHGENMFSKFMFKVGNYNNISVADYDRTNRSTDYKYNLVNLFALKMALDAKNLNGSQLNQLLVDETLKKD
jgi:hypothetical protein